MQKPRITIVTPSYNQGEFLEQTLRSVLDQGYENLQYIVIDGGSTDNSIAILERYRDRLSTVIIGPDRGQSDAINKGFRLADGDLVAWINSDDYLLPGSLEAWSKAYRENPDAIAWAGGVLMVDKDGRFLQNLQQTTGTTDQIALSQTPGGAWIFQQGCAFSRTGLGTDLRIREDLHYILDIEFFYRLASLGRIHLIEGTIGAYRIHSQAKTTRDVILVESEYLGWLASLRRKDLVETRFNKASIHALRLLIPDDRLLWRIRLPSLVRHLGRRIANGILRRMGFPDVRSRYL